MIYIYIYTHKFTFGYINVLAIIYVSEQEVLYQKSMK